MTTVQHFEASRWREWCVAKGHPGSTYNPLQDRTWCACGEVVTEGDTKTHDLCCRPDKPVVVQLELAI